MGEKENNRITKPQTETVLNRIKNEFSINKGLVPTKASFFFYVSGVQSFMPFMTLHMKQIGLTTNEIGVVYAIVQIFVLFGTPLAGMLADKIGNYGRMFAVLLVLNAIVHTSFLTYPNASEDFVMNCDENGHSLYWKNCPENCSQSLTNLTIKSCTSSCDSTKEQLNFCLHSGMKEKETICQTFNVSSLFDIEFEPFDEAELNSNPEESCNYNWISIQKDNTSYDDVTCPDCSITCLVEGVDCSPQKYEFGKLFYTYIIVRIFGMTLISFCYSLMNAIAHKTARDYNSDFGRQNVMKALSNALAPLLTSALMTLTRGSGSKNQNFSPVFILGDIFLLLVSIIVIRMDVQIPKGSKSILKDCLSVLSRIEVSLFLVILLILGTLWGFMDSYLFIYLKQMDAPDYLLGLNRAIGQFAVIPAFFWSKEIMGKVGHFKIFFFCFIAYFVKYLGISHITYPWYALPFECIDMVPYGLGWITVIDFLTTITPKHLLATIIALAITSHFTFGRGVGALVGSRMISKFGIAYSLFYFSFVALIGAALLVLFYLLVFKKKIQEREEIERARETAEEGQPMMEVKQNNIKA